MNFFPHIYEFAFFHFFRKKVCKFEKMGKKIHDFVPRFSKSLQIPRFSTHFLGGQPKKKKIFFLKKKKKNNARANFFFDKKYWLKTHMIIKTKEIYLFTVFLLFCRVCFLLAFLDCGYPSIIKFSINSN